MSAEMKNIRSKIEAAQKLLEEVAEALRTSDEDPLKKVASKKEIDEFAQWVADSANGKIKGGARNRG